MNKLLILILFATQLSQAMVSFISNFNNKKKNLKIGKALYKSKLKKLKQ